MSRQNHPPLSQVRLQTIQKSFLILSLILSLAPSLAFAQEPVPSFLQSPVVIFTPTLLPSADTEMESVGSER